MSVNSVCVCISEQSGESVESVLNCQQLSAVNILSLIHSTAARDCQWSIDCSKRAAAVQLVATSAVAACDVGWLQFSAVDEFCVLPARREHCLYKYRRAPAPAAALPASVASQGRLTAAAEWRHPWYMADP